MSCVSESVLVASRVPLVPDRSGRVHEGVLAIGPLRLHHGGELADVRIAWRLAGNLDGPTVAVLGGISAGRAVYALHASEGWWDTVVGPGRALDSETFAILGIDFLGGSGATSGPRAGSFFPCVSSYDQSTLLARVLDHLGIARLHGLVGASYGGMVGLAFAERHPHRIDRLVALSAADRAHPLATAWRSIERRIVREAVARGEGERGLAIARALAMATYRSSREFEQRFGGPPRIDGDEALFPVQEYLFARGESYAGAYVPEAFVCLSESIDLHRVDAAAITTPTTLIAILEDQLVPVADLRRLAARLAGPVDLVELSSIYGHDAFLKEVAALRPVLGRALAIMETCDE